MTLDPAVPAAAASAPLLGDLTWVEVAWPMMAAVCLALGAFHAAVWMRDRKRWSLFCFAGTAFAVVAIAGFELAYMSSPNVERSVELVRWGHLYVFLLALFIVGYVRFHFGSVRRVLNPASASDSFFATGHESRRLNSHGILAACRA